MTPLLPLTSDVRTLELASALASALDPTLARRPLILQACADLGLGTVETVASKLLVSAEPALARGRDAAVSLRRVRIDHGRDQAVATLAPLQRLELRFDGPRAFVARVPLPLPKETGHALLVQHLFLARLEHVLAALGTRRLEIAPAAAAALERCGEVVRIRGYRSSRGRLSRRLPTVDDALRR